MRLISHVDVIDLSQKRMMRNQRSWSPVVMSAS
jgi:hypothetical protein